MNLLYPALLLSAIALLASACGQTSNTAAPRLASKPAPSAAQAADQSRISVQPLKPTKLAASLWQVAVVARYEPLIPGAPGTTSTTESRANCPQQPYDFTPVLFKCQRTYARSVDLQLAPRQITLADDKTLNLDFAPLIKDGGADYQIANLSLQIQLCAAGCAQISTQLDISCFAGEERATEIFTQEFQLLYLGGPKVAGAASECGLKNREEFYWANRQTLLARLRGHYGAQERMISRELLDSFSAIATRNGQWIWNPTAFMGTFQDFCPISNGGYSNSDYQTQLASADGWPYDPSVTVRVHSKSNGEICAIRFDGSDTHDGIQSSVTTFYEFAAGRLVQVRVDGPGDVERTWRYVDDLPMEYIQRKQGDLAQYDADEVFYWHQLAAKEWPELFDYPPNLPEFATRQALARQFVQRFPPINTPAEQQ
ncbi:MAG: hypothetical protein K2X80_16675 [Pseudomonadaceae bacterium]|nr:hypothetical protein [Pseudomonadaceae bacterium]